MRAAHVPTAAPRWPTLLALVAAVLGVHLALLLGGPPWVDTPAGSAPAQLLPAAQPHTRIDGAEKVDPVPVAAVARVSTVRWIVPAAPLVEQTPPPAAVAHAVARTRPAIPAQVPVAPPVATGADPKRAPAVEAPPVAGFTPAEPASAEQLALAEPRASDTETERAPAPSVEAEAIAAPDEALLAAAAVKQRAPAASAAAPLPPAQPPASTRLDYAVTGRAKGIGYNAEGRLDWTLADGRYSARMEMKVFLLGSRVQTSSGRVGPAGLSPERFADRSRSEKAAHFDAEQNRIRFSNNAPDAALQPGAQDRLSLFLQIAGLLQARPQAYATGQTIEMQVAGTGDADIWRFMVGDEVTLSLPAGEVRARQIKRMPRKEFDSTVEMWLAPDLQHLPVRLRVTQANGDVADQQLSRMP